MLLICNITYQYFLAVRDTVIVVQNQPKSMQNHLDGIEKKLLAQNNCPSMSLPPVNMFTIVTTPTRINGQLMKPTLSGMTNHPINQSFDSPSSLTMPSPKASTTLPTNSQLEKITADKERNPLPPINRSTLLQPTEVVEKYPKLAVFSKIPTLAVHLSKESYFGKGIMILCTFRGMGTYHALPEEELAKLKAFYVNSATPGLLVHELSLKTCG